MKRLTVAMKHAIAADYVAGLSVSELCSKHGITAGGFRRLRREDTAYQEAEGELLHEVIDQTCRSLRLKAEQAVNTLTSILSCDRGNLREETGPNGGVIQKRIVDVKLLGEQRLAAATLIDFWLKLRASDEDRRRWDLENLSGDDDEEDPDDENEAAQRDNGPANLSSAPPAAHPPE